MNDSAPTRDYRSLLKKALLEIQGLRAQLADAGSRDREALAIIGIGCRFPGGITDPNSFWQLLRTGGDAVDSVPRERWNRDTHYGPELVSPETIHTRRGGFLDQIDWFDPAFFALSAGEATAMDPQQRLLLEVAWEAFEHAGLPAERMAGSRTGVYLGITNICDYYKGLRTFPSRSGTGVSNCIAANRLSYQFDLRGPSLSLDTACSSSLVALHLAGQSLRQRKSDMALVGGVNAILSPDWAVTFSMAGMMSKEGLCKSFDASADGYVRAEGCAVILVKRFVDAQRDGDRIVALIRGTAVNQDGLSSGLTVPHGAAQQEVIQQALDDAGVAPADISFVEAHGIGTEMGDPIELGALKTVLGRDRAPDQACRIGSVKANIGHAEAASGLSGLIKTVLALNYEAIPPQLHLRKINPLIELEGTPFGIPTQLEPWPAGYSRRLACVNSFGLGGTNAHVILEAPPPSSAPGSTESMPTVPLVLPLSAKTRPALQELAARYAALLTSPAPPPLADICYTAGIGRSHFLHRLALTTQPDGEKSLADRLRTFADDKTPAGPAPGAVPPRIALICGCNAEMLEQPPAPEHFDHPRIMAAIQQCEEALGSSAPTPTGQLMSRQYGLYRYLLEMGIVPTVVLGHGIGEYLAAHIAGAITLEEAAVLAASFQAATPAPAVGGTTPRRRWISGLHGEYMPVQSSPDPAYWQRQLRESPDPSVGLATLSHAEIDLCIILGGRAPGGDPSPGQQWLYPWVSGLGAALASLYIGGATLQWEALHARKRTRVDLPAYPFQRIRCWLDASELRHYE